MHFLNRYSIRLAIAASGIVMGAVQVGCDPTSPSTKLVGRAPVKAPAVAPESDQPVAPPKETLPSAIEVAAARSPWISPQQLPWEAWYLQYQDGQRIGYSHVRVSKSSLENETKLIHIQRTDLVEVVGDGKPTILRRTMESKEYSDGRLISLRDITRTEDQESVTEGNLVNNVFNATTTVGEEVTTNSVVWEEGTWGVMGLQAMLMQRPPQPGELLSGKVFVPQIYKIAKTELLAGQPEITTLPGGKTETLLPVEIVLWADDIGMRSLNWLNSSGEVLKTISRSGPRLSTFWTRPELAEPVRDEYALGELLHLRVPVSGEQFDLATAKQVTYNLARSAGATGEEVYRLLAKSPQQTVTSLNALMAEAIVSQASRPEPGTSAAAPAIDLPSEAYLAASPWIPADHSRIQALVQSFVPELNPTSPDSPQRDSLDPGELASQLVQGVHRAVKSVQLDRQVVHPLTALQQASGDCVEQSLLLVSLLRSQQIPARVAAGLAVQADQPNQMQFAMWTEAWIADRWVALDPVTGKLAAADRLKILDSNIAGHNPYVAILPVFRELSGLEVKILAHE